VKENPSNLRTENPATGFAGLGGTVRHGVSVPSHRYAFTREGAAEALAVSPSTIDRLTKRGLLRPSRATRRPLYSAEELQRFLRETTAAVGV